MKKIVNKQFSGIDVKTRNQIIIPNGTIKKLTKIWKKYSWHWSFQNKGKGSLRNEGGEKMCPRKTQAYSLK